MHGTLDALKVSVSDYYIQTYEPDWLVPRQHTLHYGKEARREKDRRGEDPKLKMKEVQASMFKHTC